MNTYESLKQKKIVDSYLLFDVSYFCLAVPLFISLTTIPYMGDEQLYALIMKAIRYVGYFLVTVKIIRTKYPPRAIYWIAIGGLLFLVAGITANNNTLVCTFLFIAGSYDLDFDEILLFCRNLLLVCILVTITLAIIGVIPNWHYVMSGRERETLGFFYPSHLSSCFFYLSIMTLYLKKDQFRFFYLVIWEILNVVVYVVSDSRAAFYVLNIIYIVFFVTKWFGKTDLYAKIVKVFSCLAFPVCAGTSLIACAVYDETGVLARINTLLSGRIRLGHSGLLQYGIHLLGQDITWIGNGGLGYTKDVLEGTYNYVDCSYLKIMFDYGVLVLLFVLVGLTLSVYQAAKNGNIYFCLAMSMIAIYSMIEPRLLEIGFSPFALCLCSYMKTSKICSRTVARGENILKDIKTKAEDDEILIAE